MPDITGVLLAAGHSRRFGSNKLLVEIDKLALVLRAAISLSPCSRLLAVVRRDDLALQKLLKEASIELVFNDRTNSDMGASIACGVSASKNSKGWCVLPADMPFVLPSTTQEIVTSLQQNATLAAPFYNGRRGHPVGFSHDLVSELLALDKEPGARGIVEKNIQRLTMINTNDAAILVDIDTPDDLRSSIEPSR
ncbi:MAG: nucleotidyltransferase family protein [Arenicellales bacterium]